MIVHYTCAGTGFRAQVWRWWDVCSRGIKSRKWTIRIIIVMHEKEIRESPLIKAVLMQHSPPKTALKNIDIWGKTKKTVREEELGEITIKWKLIKNILKEQKKIIKLVAGVFLHAYKCISSCPLLLLLLSRKNPIHKQDQQAGSGDWFPELCLCVHMRVCEGRKRKTWRI